MKAYHHLIIITSIFTITSCQPVSYSKVKFVLGQDKTTAGKRQPLNRNARSFGHHFPVPLTLTQWNNGFEGFLDDVVFPPPPLIYNYQFERGHITPDFSNGLDYPDPLLLTGKQALFAVKYLYGRGELFYNQIPHVRALLNNQEERRRNGLAGHYLSSNRPGSPFYRA